MSQVSIAAISEHWWLKKTFLGCRFVRDDIEVVKQDPFDSVVQRMVSKNQMDPAVPFHLPRCFV